MSYSSRKRPLRVAALAPTRPQAPHSSSFAATFLTRRLPTLVVAAGFLCASGSAWAAVTALPYSWGYNSYGQLGNGTSGSQSARPVAVTVSGLPAGVTFTQVSAGIEHSIALGSDGQVYTWGANYYNQLGRSIDTTPQNVPGVVAGLNNVVQVAAGYYHCVALCSDGTVYTWGYSGYGQLGRDVSTSNTVPGMVKGNLSGKKVTQIGTGGYHTFAIDQDGTLYAWGANWYGQLGLGGDDYSSRPEPAVVPALPGGKKATQIAAGYAHTVALDTDGKVFAWGYNWDGELGDGTDYNNSGVFYKNSAVAVVGLGTGVQQIAAGEFHSVALDANGKVFTWGQNSNGQLGRSTPGYWGNVAGEVEGALKTQNEVVTQISTGTYHSMALCLDGSLYSWGYGGHGQLGNNSFGPSDTPVGVDFTPGSALENKTVTGLMKGGLSLHSLVLATAAPSNTAPVLSSVIISPSSPKTNDELTVTPSASDADAGDVLTFTYTWKKNGEPIVGASGPTLNLATANFGSKGDVITVDAVASDGKGGISNSKTSDEVTILNSAPTLPSGTTLSLDSASPKTGDTLTATRSADATDADGDSISYVYKWFKNDVEIPGETGNTLDLSKPGNGDKGDVIKVEMTATDNTDNSEPLVATSTATVANSTPTISQASLAPTAPTTKGTLNSTVVAQDADTGDSLTTTYVWKKNGEPIPNESGQNLDLSKDGNGESGDKITVTATVTDGVTGSSVSKTSNEVTIANTAPVASKVTLAPLDPTTKTELTATPVIGDDDALDTLTYSYKWFKNGVEIPGETGPTLDLAKAGNGDKGQSITVEAKANDGTVDSNTVTSQPVVILNSAPVASSVSISPSNPTPTSTLTATRGADATDDDLDTLTYYYQWYRGSTMILGATGAGKTLDLGALGAAAGEVFSVQMIASDGTLDSNIVTSTPVTVGADAPGNVAPVISSLTLTPGRAFTDSTLTANVSAADGDGDPLTTTYVWKKGGVVIQGESGNKLNLSKAGNGDKDEKITVTVTVSDGKGGSASATSPELVISNSGPSITSLVLTPEKPTTNDTVHTTLAASDPDGDSALTYLFVWKRNDVVLTGETGPSLDLSKAGNGNKGDKISLEVKARDGRANSAPVTSSFIVASTAPVISSVTLSPAAPKTNQIVTANPVATDVDGDVPTFSYVWMKNGVVIPNESGKTLDLSKAGNGDRADKISVDVVAHDGQESSTPFTSNAITVANTSPVATGVTVTPTNPTTTSVLTANASGTDVDNDKLSFLYQWKKNNVAIPGATAQTLDLSKAGNGDSGDVITVEAKARDNSANSAPVFSAPVTIAADAATGSVPTITSVTLSPASPKTQDIVKATVNAIGVNGDSDGLTFSYIWKNGGTPIAGETGSTLDLAKVGNGDKGQTITVEVVAHEGGASSDTASASATVANTASAPTSVVLSSYGPGTNDVLTATAQGFDVDGDPFTFLYQWKKNGSVIAGETGPTLNLGKAGNGDTGDKITVEVKTRDAAGQSAPLASAPATVSGAPAALAAARRSAAPSANGS